MGLKLHSWRETEAGLESKGLVLLHHVTSEGTTGERAALPIPGGLYSWGTGRQAPPQICTTSKGLSTNSEERLQWAEGAAAQPGEMVAIWSLAGGCVRRLPPHSYLWVLPLGPP